MSTKTGVIYLQRDKFQIYSPFLRQILEFRFTPQMVLDLDVLSEELLREQIKVFVTNAKIAPSNLIIVLSDNSYFVKDFALTQSLAQPTKPGQPPTPVPKASIEDLKPQIDLFVEHVPYENVVSKTFPLKNGVRVCAVNQDFYRTVQIGFEKMGFSIESVFPGMVLGGGLSAKPVLDGSLTNIILQKAASLKQFDLKLQEAFTPDKKKETEQIDEVEEEIEKGNEPPKTNKKRLIAMISILGILLVVLVIVFIQSQQPPPPPPQQVLAPQPTSMPSLATPTTVQEKSAILAASQTQTLTIQLSHTADALPAAQSLKTALSTYNFKSISLRPQNSVSSATTIVSFSGATPQVVRDVVLKEVRKVKSAISVQESQQATSDVFILIGK